MTTRIATALTLTLAACAPAAPAPTPVTLAPTTTTTTTAPTTTTTTHPKRTVTTRAARVRVAVEAAQTEGMPGQDVTLACIRHWESHGNYRAVSRSGTYRGAYQYDQRTWESNGGTGDPATASVEEQDSVAATTLARRGLEPWPTPARRCA